MPDWSYQTLIRPALFQLPPERARAFTLGALRLLGQIPFGIQLIALMGHMQPPASLSRTHFGQELASPVGLGADLPGNEHALLALSHFGVGFLELGPVANTAHSGQVSLVRQIESETLQLRPVMTRSVDQLVDMLQHTGPLPTALAVRLGHASDADAQSAAAERVAMIEKLAPYVQFLTLTPPPSSWGLDTWCAHLSRVLEAAQHCPLLVGVSIDVTDDDLRQTIEPALAQGAAGVLICNGITGPEGTRLLGAPARVAAQAIVRRTRLLTGSGPTIIVAGGAQSPADTLAQLDAGADLVALDSGLVFGGPGLPKRTNEAIRALGDGLPTPQLLSAHSAKALLGAGWLWMLLLGLSMILGGVLAWGIAATTVVLPYDLEFVGLEQNQMAALNPRLLHFMAHDRVSLAGTMIAIGVLYTQIAWHGLRRREHWAKRAIVVSAATGFVSFFLFLGYGYFDPLHAAVSFALLPFFVLGAWSTADAPPAVPTPDLQNDTAWELANWGQLGAVSLGIGLTAAGAVIAFVGITTVFVPEDLRYLGTTAPVLDRANAKLVSLIAHDRAGFGGALVSMGLGMLLLSLWGIRRGACWVWWTLFLAGLPGFIGALGVHLTVGYLDLWHLFPGLLALLVFGTTLALLYPYLCGFSEGRMTNDE